MSFLGAARAFVIINFIGLRSDKINVGDLVRLQILATSVKAHWSGAW